jgi:hypothetical protein
MCRTQAHAVEQPSRRPADKVPTSHVAGDSAVGIACGQSNVRRRRISLLAHIPEVYVYLLRVVESPIDIGGRRVRGFHSTRPESRSFCIAMMSHEIVKLLYRVLGIPRTNLRRRRLAGRSRPGTGVARNRRKGTMCRRGRRGAGRRRHGGLRISRRGRDDLRGCGSGYRVAATRAGVSRRPLAPHGEIAPRRCDR